MNDHDTPEPVIDQSRSSRNDLIMMVVTVGIAVIMFIAPQVNSVVTNLAAGTSVVPITDLGESGVAASDGTPVQSIDAIVSLTQYSAVVATLLVVADVLTPLAWTAVLVVTALLARQALRGGLFSRRFERGLGWLFSLTLIAAFVPAVLRFMASNAVIEAAGWEGAAPAAFEAFWIVLILATAQTLMFVMYRSGRRLANDQAGTI